MVHTVVVIKARQPFSLRRGNSQNADWRETALRRHERVATTTKHEPSRNIAARVETAIDGSPDDI